MINPPSYPPSTFHILLLTRAEKTQNASEESGIFFKNDAVEIMLECWRHLMTGRFCPFFVQFLLYKSQQTLWKLSPASWKTFCSRSQVSKQQKRLRAELTAQPRHLHCSQTPTIPNTLLRDLFFLILGIVAVSPVMACNSRLLLGVSTFLCLYSVCL